MFLTKQIIKYIISGGSAAIIMFSSLYIFTEYIGLWYVYSVIASFLIAFIVSFTMQKLWTFGDKDKEFLHKQVTLYLSISVFNLVFNSGGVYLLVEKLDFWYMGAQFLVSSILAISSFIIYKFLIFNGKRDVPNIQKFEGEDI